MSRAVLLLGVGCLASLGCDSYKTAPAAGSFPVANLPGGALPSLSTYQVNVWAKGTADYKNPDSIDYDPATGVWVGYQNVTAKDGTDDATSTVVQYSRDGQVVLKTYSVPGHCDGLRIDRKTHLVWASSNEDGNPRLVSIDPSSGTITPYTFPTPPHGGGYDDMYFLNGKMFIVASAPVADSSGAFSAPAVASVTFSGTNVVLAPVLMGNDTAIDTSTGSSVTLAESDPDSLSSDTAGNLILINQGGMELVTISNPGAANQAVTRTPVGTQLDDTVWVTSAKGQLLVTDGKANTIYSITTNFVPGTVYTQTPDDSGVSSILGTLNLDPKNVSALGYAVVNPVVLGFKKATGMLFLPDAP